MCKTTKCFAKYLNTQPSALRTQHGHTLSQEVFSMKTYFLTFRSITQAQRAERAYSRAGMVCTMRRTPRWMEERDQNNYTFLR